MVSPQTIAKPVHNPSATPQIQVSNDYALFKFMGGNRSVDYAHVQRLKNEMKENLELLQAAPILVNEHLFIVDGQHRFEAAKELLLPIYYLVKPGLTIDAARSMNVTQKRWTIMDFAKSYAEGGKEDYREFIRIANRFRSIAPAIVIKFLAGGQRHHLSEDFRRGLFAIDDLEKAEKYLERIQWVEQTANIKINTPMALSFFYLFEGKDSKVDEFDWTKFQDKLSKHKGAVELFTTSTTVRNSLRSIEDVYNFMSNTRSRLY